jgi:hypothetical protein
MIDGPRERLWRRESPESSKTYPRAIWPGPPARGRGSRVADTLGDSSTHPEFVSLMCGSSEATIAPVPIKQTRTKHEESWLSFHPRNDFIDGGGRSWQRYRRKAARADTNLHFDRSRDCYQFGAWHTYTDGSDSRIFFPSCTDPDLGHPHPRCRLADFPPPSAPTPTSIRH